MSMQFCPININHVIVQFWQCLVCAVTTKKRVNRDKTGFATKLRMFGPLIIDEGPSLSTTAGRAVAQLMTHFKLEVMIHCKGVSKILTANRIWQIIFPFYHLIEEIPSFPTMYNTRGGSWGKFGETKYFLPKSGKKKLIFAVMVPDQLTSEWAGSPSLGAIIFEVSLTSTSVLKKLEHKLWNELCGRRQSSKLSDWRPFEKFFGLVTKKC